MGYVLIVMKILYSFSIVTDYYKCSCCGEETQQYVNGSIKYLKITDQDKQWLKNQSSE
jgi:hypothetical protein